MYAEEVEDEEGTPGDLGVFPGLEAGLWPELIFIPFQSILLLLDLVISL